MQEDLIQHGTEFVAVAFVLDGGLHCLRDRAAETSGGSRELGQNLAADLGGVARGRGDLRAVGSHHLAAEGLLLVRHFHHEHLQVKPEEAAGHAEGCAPLPRSGLRGHALQALLLSVVGLGDCGVQLVRTGGVVTFEFVVDLRRGLQSFLKEVRSHEGRRTVHFVEVQDFFRDRNILSVVIQLLFYEFLAENGLKLLSLEGLTGSGIKQRSRLILHICTDIIPTGRDLFLGEVDLIGDFLLHRYNN